MTMERQPLRSFLFAPGNHARRVEKALSLDADAVILDLEDAVATAEKPATREAVAAASGRPRRGWLYVRVNAADTDFCYGDLVAIVRPRLDGIILPKVESPAALATTIARSRCRRSSSAIARTPSIRGRLPKRFRSSSPVPNSARSPRNRSVSKLTPPTSRRRSTRS